MIHMLVSIDINIFRFFNGTMHNEILDIAMPFITEMGNGIFIFVIGVILIFAGVRKVRFSGILLLAGLSVTYYAVHIIKNFVERQRPFIALPDVKILYSTGGFSFPSNHSATVFMAAFILSWCFGKRYFFYPVACLVAVSRMYLGFHYPVDVTIGAVLGLMIGYVLVRVSESMNKG